MPGFATRTTAATSSPAAAAVRASILLLAACGSPGEPQTASIDPRTHVVVRFAYGSEKQRWLEAMTREFNAGRHETAAGKAIVVESVPMGSGQSIDEILAGRLQAHLVSPASSAYVQLGNARSQATTGRALVTSTRELVLSPVVIAMWKPMAEALGRGRRPIGWADVLRLTTDRDGWAKHGVPQWGPFRFGHTHPDSSSSGLLALLAEVYAATGQTTGLTLADVERPEVAEFLRRIDASVGDYGSSTGSFGRQLFDSGPESLSAAVLYENMVVESHDRTRYRDLPFPIVSIYPAEGTFWSDHPAGIVERPWVGPEHREAAAIYVDWLLQRPQQVRALQYGFRPADVQVPVTAPLDVAHGVDPNEPRTSLQVPGPDVMDAILELWHRQGHEHASPGVTPAQPGPESRPATTVRIAYGTEKRDWLEWAAREFVATPAGRRYAIELVPIASLEGARAVVQGRGFEPIHAWAPASSAWRDLFESEWRLRYRSAPILRSANLALTPLVFVMWKERYECFADQHALSTFAGIAAAVRAPGGWSTLGGRPAWGMFKFGHTHPSQSNSGLLAVALMAYEHAGKTSGLTVDDVARDGFQQWLHEFEALVTKPDGDPAEGTGDLMREMVLRGPSQYDAVMVYENLAIEHLKAARGRWDELHVAYPACTMWNENPYYVLDAPWSGADERRGAGQFLDFLLSERVQRRALELGFRPGNPNVRIDGPGSPFTRYGSSGLRIDVPAACEPPRAEILRNLVQSCVR